MIIPKVSASSAISFLTFLAIFFTTASCKRLLDDLQLNRNTLLVETNMQHLSIYHICEKDAGGGDIHQVLYDSVLVYRDGVFKSAIPHVCYGKQYLPIITDSFRYSKAGVLKTRMRETFDYYIKVDSASEYTTIHWKVSNTELGVAADVSDTIPVEGR